MSEGNGDALTDDDPWIKKNGIVSAQRAHAVGLITLYWNFCEEGVRSLLTHYSGMARVDAARFTYGMRAPTMAATLRSFLTYLKKKIPSSATTLSSVSS
ncbi:MAG: hypothetical protein KDK08_06565 [Rhizobiaceae bacterium]|nr:hypothetical protein [Rhizobiaceae bacterium]